MRNFFLLVCVALVAVAVGCSDPTGIPEAILRLDSDSIMLRAIGASAQVHAALEHTDGSPATAIVSWRTLSPQIVSVDQAGTVTAVAPGDAVIEAHAAGASAQLHVAVQQAVAKLELAPYPAQVSAPDSLKLAVQATDSLGHLIANPRISWHSSHQDEYSPVDSTGLAQLRSAGNIVIVASANGASDTARIAVRVQFDSVTAGDRHTCALTTTGDPYCWGDPTSAQLGFGGTAGEIGPVLSHTSDGPVRMVQITGGGTHNCGISAAGRAYCWGSRLLTGTFYSKHIAPLDSAIVFKQVSAGTQHTCGVAADGGVFCWGLARKAEIGRDTFIIQIPERMTSPTRFMSVASGGSHTCGIDTNQHAYCWGANDVGQLGRGTTDDSAHASPQLISGSLRFTSLSAGNGYTCGITTTGVVYCWGANESAQLGVAVTGETCATPNGPTSCATRPVQVSLAQPVSRITTGTDHTCAIAAGALFCWGGNSYGKSGGGMATFVTSPTQIAGNWTAVAAGKDHTCGIRQRLLLCWGDDGNNQLGNGVMRAPSYFPVPVAFQE